MNVLKHGKCYSTLEIPLFYALMWCDVQCGDSTRVKCMSKVYIIIHYK